MHRAGLDGITSRRIAPTKWGSYLPPYCSRAWTSSHDTESRYTWRARIVSYSFCKYCGVDVLARLAPARARLLSATTVDGSSGASPPAATLDEPAGAMAATSSPAVAVAAPTVPTTAPIASSNLVSLHAMRESSQDSMSAGARQGQRECAAMAGAGSIHFGGGGVDHADALVRGSVDLRLHLRPDRRLQVAKVAREVDSERVEVRLHRAEGVRHLLKRWQRLCRRAGRTVEARARLRLRRHRLRGSIDGRRNAGNRRLRAHRELPADRMSTDCDDGCVIELKGV